MQRHRILAFLGVSSGLLLAGCCLPPVSHLSEEEAMRFAPRFDTDTFLARIRFSPSNPAPNSSKAPIALIAAITEESTVRSALRDAGYEILTLGGPTTTTLAFNDGSQVAWLRVTQKAVDLAAKDRQLTSDEDDMSTSWGRAHRQADHLRALLSKDPRLTGLARARVYVEPNLEQTYPYDRSWSCPLKSATGSEIVVNGTPNPDWPRPDSKALDWHLDDDHTQLRSASQDTWSAQEGVRIAHLDTGFDTEHIARPPHLDQVHERNVLEFPPRSGPDSAADPGKPEGIAGWACFNGHGTGTLSLLSGPDIKTAPGSFLTASGPLGAAPNATVIPIRMANSVIHIDSQTMGDGIFYAARPLGLGGGGADVISISAGGLPSQYWADAVNYAYENGVVIAAATGDNIHDLPVRGTIWPARFKRVIAVAGATSKNEPYDRFHSNASEKWMMEGSYGPDYVMKHALAAYTPNTGWAEWEKHVTGQTHVKVDPDGGGTSAATPQVAGAAALYLAKYPTLSKVHDWTRTESTRQALFHTAWLPKTTDNDLRYFGNGILKAQRALGASPEKLGKLQEEPADVICSPFLEAITGVPACDSDRAQMLAVEVAQLISADRKYETIDWDDPDQARRNPRAALRTTGLRILIEDKRTSRQLRDAISAQARELRVDLQ